MWYVYVIKSKTSDFIYIGSTNDLKRRFVEHNEGLSTATKPYKPYELLSYIAVKSDPRLETWNNILRRVLGKLFCIKEF